MGTSVGIKKGKKSKNKFGIGTSLEVFHENHDPNASQNYVDHTFIFINPVKVSACPHTESDYTELEFFGENESTNSQLTTNFIGIDYDMHWGVGFHIKIGFNF